MTITYEYKKNENYLIQVQAESFSNGYHTRAFENIGGNWHKVKDNIYPTREKAVARLNRIANEYKV